MRQIVLDTETTGLDPNQGHRVIEIGCIELFNRRPTGKNLHYYLQPERAIDAGAIAVHGITDTFLKDKPKFAQIADELILFLKGAELVIHNAAFDMGFLNAELARLSQAIRLDDHCSVIDTLMLARRMHPRQKNNLDALCKRYEIDNTAREYHGALLDAELLAEVYLRMTSGQTELSFHAPERVVEPVTSLVSMNKTLTSRQGLIYYADADELAAHTALMQHVKNQL